MTDTNRIDAAWLVRKYLADRTAEARTALAQAEKEEAAFAERGELPARWSPTAPPVGHSNHHSEGRTQ
ncbi:hypothetical protein ACFXAZ_34485 [Streptomyces sp. NPDC059477]|uniref:hypothetical protein n=1 Tax=Streptomyces sp. NPDC059477 TaxID=3346847 RepID=UPI003682E81A